MDPCAVGSWKRLTVTPQQPQQGPPALDQDLVRGEELPRVYTSNVAFGRMGQLELLHWSFWKDLARNRSGDGVPSRDIGGGQAEVVGMFWSHSLG